MPYSADGKHEHGFDTSPWILLRTTSRRMVVSSVIRAPNQRTGSYVLEPLLLGDLFIKLERFRPDILDNGQMVRSRPQILTEGQNLNIRLAQIIHRLK